jgi:two-component system NtrC family sensor kinase/two-component system sensor histidine kinase AtoS
MFSKGVEAAKERFLWSELEQSLLESIEYYAYSKDIAFIFPQEDFELVADKDLLEMLFSNFIINAIDAIESDDSDEGVVEIVYSADTQTHTFTIYDSGVAIEDKKNLFEAFKSTKLKGNGLGLVLSRQIAQAHGGDVMLCDGERKCFRVSIAK